MSYLRREELLYVVQQGALYHVHMYIYVIKKNIYKKYKKYPGMRDKGDGTARNSASVCLEPGAGVNLVVRSRYVEAITPHFLGRLLLFLTIFELLFFFYLYFLKVVVIDNSIINT